MWRYFTLGESAFWRISSIVAPPPQSSPSASPSLSEKRAGRKWADTSMSSGLLEIWISWANTSSVSSLYCTSIWLLGLLAILTMTVSHCQWCWYYSLNGHPSGPSFRRQFFPQSSSVHPYLLPRCSANFAESVQVDFHWAGLQMKAQTPYIQVVAKKGFPMVYPRMQTKQVQWQNWDGCVGRFFFSFFIIFIAHLLQVTLEMYS